MTAVDYQKIAERWIEYHRLTKDEKETSDRFSAWLKLNDLVRNEPELAWIVMEEIRRCDSSDLILSNLAAGPLEDLLVYHGEKFIERFESLASRDSVFRKLLGAVWQNEIPDDVWTRLKDVAGPPF